MTIPEIIQKMVGEQVMPKYCTVDSIDGYLCDVTEISTETQILDVRLQTQEGNGLLYIPKIGSVVTVLMVNEVEGVVVQYSELDSIQLGDGSYDGITKVNSVVTKLNTLEDDVNTLKDLISGWVPVPTDGGASLKTLLTTWYQQSITNTVKADLENNKITHGDF